MKLVSIVGLAFVASASARSLPVVPTRSILETRGGAAAVKSAAPVKAQAAPVAAAPVPAGLTVFGMDVPLLTYFFFWFLGNYYYNIWNKNCLKAAGGKDGYPMTVSTLQLGVGCVYALALWAVGLRKKPTTTGADLKAMAPVSFTNMGAHSASVFALSAGAVSFGQIVKAAEPAFAAVISALFYGKKISVGKWLMLVPIIGGVILASVKELDFAWSALIAACVANVFAAVKGSENKKLMDTVGIKDRIGGVNNQFALTTLISFVLAVPLMLATEGSKMGGFVTLLKENEKVRNNLLLSGMSFYLYNELATLTIKKTNAVTQSVANTAKRVIVIVGVALVMGESLEFMKLLGCSIGILGVFLYSVIDMIWKP